MKTQFAKMVKRVRKGEDTKGACDLSRGLVPLEFISAAMGVYPRDPKRFETTFQGITLGYFVVDYLLRFEEDNDDGSSLLRREAFPGVEWTDDSWFMFLLCRNHDGQTVAHRLAENGCLSKDDFLRIAGTPDYEEHTVAHVWAACKPLPREIFTQSTAWKTWVDKSNRGVDEVAMVNGNLPEGFAHWDTHSVRLQCSLASLYLDHHYRDYLFFPSTPRSDYDPGDQVNGFTCADFPWGDNESIWSLSDDDHYTVAHLAATYNVLPSDIPKSILFLTNRAGFTVKEVAEESKQIYRQICLSLNK